MTCRLQSHQPLPLINYKFTTSAIVRILKNPYYVGLIRRRGELHDGKHEPIIKEELFQRVQDQMAKNTGRHRFDGRRSVRGHMLAKLIRCRECGNGLYASIQGTQRAETYYKMPKRAKGPECRYAGRSFNGSSIDRVVDQLFGGFELLDDWRDYVKTRFIANTKIEDLFRRRESLLEKKGRVNELFFDSEIDRPERDARVRRIEEELEETKVLSDDAVESAGELLEDFRSLWALANARERNDLLRIVLEAVYIDIWNT